MAESVYYKFILGFLCIQAYTGMMILFFVNLISFHSCLAELCRPSWFAVRLSAIKKAKQQTFLHSNKLSGPLLEPVFLPKALNTLSIYNKSSEALLAEPRNAPEEALAQGDYLRCLKAALTWGSGNVNDCAACNTVYLAVSDSQWPPKADKSSLQSWIPLFFCEDFFFLHFFFFWWETLAKFH